MARVLIFGSCVSRDAFKRLDEGFDLEEYVARQSVISSASAPTKLLGTGNLTSAFQIRSVRNDHRSSLFNELSGSAGTIDLLLMDLIDERLGVVNLSDGTWVTYSSELVRSGALDSLPERPSVLNLGTDRHFFAWRRSVGRLIARLELLGIKEKALVLQAPWAAQTEDAEPTPSFRGRSAEEMNDLYKRYYDHLELSGMRMAKMPRELAICPTDHQWGTAAYHYVEPAYGWMCDQIRAAV